MGERPRIVLMPGNNVLVDARVLKNLGTAASLGLDAIALGVDRKGPGRELSVGGANIRIVHVPERLQNSGWFAWSRNLSRFFTPWYATPADEKSARLRLAYLGREAAASQQRRLRDADREPLQQPRHRTWKEPFPRFHYRLARGIVRVRRGLTRRVRKPEISLNSTEIAAQEQARSRTLGLLRIQEHWRSRLPHTIDDDVVLGPILDELQPDIIHVHDVFMMGVAARAAGRAAQQGRRVRLVYDAREYLPGLANIDLWVVAAYCNMEVEFLPDFDRVITVSDQLADLLVRDHKLRRRPDLVLNAPVVGDEADSIPSVREVAGVPSDAPLLVYGGGINPARGVQTVIEALAELPGVHFALVARSSGAFTRRLQQLADSLGVGDRFHVVGFVPAEHVTGYFASADIGLSPLLHAINHDVALTNKFCEYLLAGLPVVTSDTPAQADLVEGLDLGAVYRAGDAADLARAVRETLARAPQLRDRIADPEIQHRFSWTAQSEVLREVYADVLGGLGEEAWRDEATRVTVITPREDAL